MEKQFKQTVKAHVCPADNTLIALPCTDFFKKCLVVGPVKFYFCFHLLNCKKCGSSMSSKYFEFENVN